MAGTLRDEIRRSILQDIINGKINISDIITEKQLCECFNVSKSPVREALIELCSSGILESIPRLGYRFLPLDRQSMVDVTELRLILEMAGLSKTEANLTDYMVQQLYDYLDHEAKTDTVDVWQSWLENYKFHILLNSMCGNVMIVNALAKALETLSRGYVQYYPRKYSVETFQLDLRGHRKIVDRLADKDFSGAKKALEEDILDLTGKLFDNPQRAWHIPEHMDFFSDGIFG